MKRLFFTLLLVMLLFMCGSSWGATYFVSPTGGAPNNGASFATGYITIAAAVAAHHAAGDIIEIDGDIAGISYNESISAKYGTVFTIQGSKQSGHNGLVTLTGVGKNAVTLTIDKEIIQNMAIVGSDSGKYNLDIGNGSPVFNDCIIGDSQGRGILIAGAYTATFNRCKIRNINDTVRCITQSGSLPTIVFNDVDYHNNLGPWYMDGILTIYNSNLIANRNSVLDIQNANNSATIKNSIIIANKLNYGSGYIITNPNSGGFHVGNCLYQGNPNNKTVFQNYTNDGGNLSTATPKMKSLPFGKAYIAIGIDDAFGSSPNYGYPGKADGITPLVAYANQKGIKVYFGASYGQNYSSEDQATIRTWAQQGHEICVHTPSHANAVSATTTGAMTLIGPANATYSITTNAPIGDIDHTAMNWIIGSTPGWGGTMVLKVGGSPVATYDLTPRTTYGSAMNLIAAINAIGGGWSATSTAMPGLSVILADHADTSCSTSQNLLVNTDRFMQYEYVEYKALLEGYAGQTVNTVIYPGGANNATLRTWVASAAHFTPFGLTPYLGGRGAVEVIWGGSATITNTTYVSGDGSVTGCQIFNVNGPRLYPILSLGNIAGDTNMYNDWLAGLGGVTFYYMHYLEELTTGGTGDAATGLANMKAFVDAVVANPNVQIVTPAQFFTIARTGIDMDGNGQRWNLTKTDQSDFRLKSSSPCKNAGIDVGLTTDFLGKKIRGLPDIGAYEYQPTQQGGGFSFGFGGF